MLKTTISNPTKVILGPMTRWSYASLWEPKSINGGKPKYSVSLIISKDDTETVNAVKAAIQAAYEKGEAKLRGKSSMVPSLDSIRTPLRDGDLERPDNEVYAGCYFLNANSDSAPQIVDANLNVITNRDEVYSGVYGRVSVTMYAYNANGNRGIACALNNLQKVSDGARLGGGKPTAAEDFATFPEEDFLK